MSIASNLRNELDRGGLSVATVAAQIQAEPSSVRRKTCPGRFARQIAFSSVWRGASAAKSTSCATGGPDGGTAS